MTAAEIVALLELAPHPEGGWYRQTFVAEVPGGRAHSTLMDFLLEAGQRSHWHRVESAEVWHWYAGAPMTIGISRDGKSVTEHKLGNDLAAGERPQVVIPSHAWQQATCLGEWSLVGCTVAPGFQFSKFEQAEPGWAPG